ncbi:PSD1 and planctomycete cytochrome C domain-containing protein [Roseimicrobium sp. ORNL1]|uniref:PSD1 and planctomycete cytochrome C domain-containing protein n=1 Tax=Roseimicrobium sp. ORNL1 TaxID=2711231 RepID=UPI0013E1E76E|nr:PSD1 and planctomycete cytochrome C domain-containing protein [Roseimicrobium sp. ORNL1]QIF04979.1 DUF1549 domain-containing protein [Roseimicrobium sp. ORNL1]
MAFSLTLRLMLMGGVSAACTASLYSASTKPEAEPVFTAEQITFFEKNVRPVLAENCYSCHEGHKAKSGLMLNSRAGVMRGTDYKKVIIPGDPENSVLIKAIRHAAGAEPMPSKKPQLAANQIDALVQWVKMGAPWPKEAAGDHHAAWEDHWAFQKVAKPPVPAIASPKLKAANPVDAFVAAKLEKAGLEFAPPADRAVLGRRLYVTLTGLPPSFEELQAFVNDPSPNAPAKLIDDLLNSPHYGERWGRYWLDVARYSDTEGYQVGGKDYRFPYAFTYRDWVVDSLNADMPYDEFLKHQIAADRIAGADTGSKNLAALGFLTVGDTFISNKDLQTDDRIDVLTRGTLGLTVTCARCHDHKFDPIPTKDYYALYGVFNSSEIPEDLPVIGKASSEVEYAAYRGEVSKVEEKMNVFRKEVFEDMRKADRMREYLAFAQQSVKEDLNGDAFRGKAGQLKLRDRVASRWREFVKRHTATSKPHAVMVAWKEFSSLPKEGFEQASAGLKDKLTKEGSPTNAVIRNELAKRPAPKSMDDVLGLYADVFVTCISGKEPDNADWQAVRSVLLEPQSPMAVPVDQVDQFFTRKDTETMTRFRNEIKKIELSSPGAPPRAMVMNDKEKPGDMRIFIRGNQGRPGEVAPRGFLTFLGGQKFTNGSGREELANAIASRDNPLTPRVIVNRVWLQHFGSPLVSQTSDFGVQTPAPVQLDLLNWLSANFMEQGWSLKSLHRMILNSRTWQQSAVSTQDKDLKDADNTLLSRQSRQRLDYEAMRDAMIGVTGTLDASKMGGRPVALNAGDVNSRRSLYLIVDRFNQATVPAMFDFANPDTHSPQRYNTTVPQQALFLMNSPFMRDQSGKLATKLPQEGSAIDSQTITALYRKVLLREPKPEEVELAQRFVNDATDLQDKPPFLWKYGAGKQQRDASGKITGYEFIPFATYNGASKSRKWWSMSKDMPDKQWSYTQWSEGGGHPGSQHAAVLRWTSPFDGTIRISGRLDRDSPNGNGIRGLVISNKQGVLINDMVAPKSEKNMEIASLNVTRGEVIDFVVDSENGDTNSDAFDWRPAIYGIDEINGKTTLLTKSDDDFNDASHWPIKRPRPQNPLSQLVQVLLMSNEFQFVD